MSQVATAVDDFAADTQGAVVDAAVTTNVAPVDEAARTASQQPVIDDFVVEGPDDAEASTAARDEKGRFARTGDPVEDIKAAPEPAVTEAVEEEGVTDPDIDVATGLKKSARPYKLVQQYEQRAMAAAREAADLRAQLEALKQAPPAAVVKPTTTEATKRPSLNDFESWDAWQAADDAWIDDKIQRTAAHLHEKAQQQSRDEQTQQQMAARFDQVTAEGQKKYPDFEAVLGAALEAGAAWSPLMTRIVLSSPSPEDLAYALAKDPASARRMAALADPVLVGVEMGTFIARLSAASTTGPAARPATTQAHAPIRSVGTSVTAAERAPDPDDEDLDAHIAYENRREREARKRRT